MSTTNSGQSGSFLSGLEVQVWLRCPDTESLWRFAQVLDDPGDDSELVPPPDGRRNLILTFAHKQSSLGEEPWQSAFLYGFEQAAYRVERGRGHGIDVEVYAVRVQPVGADLRPAVPASAGGAIPMSSGRSYSSIPHVRRGVVRKPSRGWWQPEDWSA